MIEVIGVSKTYGKKICALANISLKISKGEFVSIVGPSGAGKSTLVKLLICEEKPISGKILIAGRNIVGLEPQELPYFRRKIGVVFQDFKLLPRKTLFENVAFALEVAGETQEKIKEISPASNINPSLFMV